MHQAIFLVTPRKNWYYSTRVEPLRGSNGLTVSIFPRFLSTLPDAFTRPLEKMCEILNKISHRRKATAKNIFNAVALHRKDKAEKAQEKILCE